MEDMKMQARSKSLGNLMNVMEEDDANSIPAVVLKITAGPGGIEIEKQGGEGEERIGEEDSMEHAGMEEGGPKGAFEMLIAKKKGMA